MGGRVDESCVLVEGPWTHRFVGANQFIPALLKLPGAETQVALTERWLRGEQPVPEIADKWAGGPAVALELLVPEKVAAGAEVTVKAVVTSNKVGHDFPTGPLDIIQSWVELTATDERGAVVFRSGGVDDRHFIAPKLAVVRVEMEAVEAKRHISAKPHKLLMPLISRRTSFKPRSSRRARQWLPMGKSVRGGE